MYLQPLLEGDLPQSLMDRFRQVQAGVDNGGSFGPLTGRASRAEALRGTSSHGSPAGLLTTRQGVPARTNLVCRLQRYSATTVTTANALKAGENKHLAYHYSATTL